MYERMKGKSKGFTLIELLIVVVIIGILATLITANFLGVRMRGRDAQRKADLNQIQTALELYRADQGSYPTGVDSLPGCGATWNVGTTVYLQKMPCDPLGTSFYNGGPYYYNGNTGSRYTLIACIENTTDPKGQTIMSAGCNTNYYYFVTSP